MNKQAKPRFHSAEAALRFYFRAREFLGDSAEGTLAIPHNQAAPLPNGDGVVKDFAAVESVLRGFGEFELWLMSELYGPTCFGARQRTLTRALRAAQARFPGRQITRSQIGFLRRRTVALLRWHLAGTGLIPPAGAYCSRSVRSNGAREGLPADRPGSRR